MIELKNVTCGYGDFPVLKDISLQIAEGDFCALLGPNGAGKSTLLYTIMGYLKPSEGYITIFEKDIAKIKHSWLAKQIAFVPQETRSEFDHTVQETVLMGRYPYLGFLQSYSSEDYEAVDAVLENLKLTEFKHRWLSEISGGEKQRVLIARALVQQTPFILLDESLSQLDINYQIEIMKLLRTIHSKENKTVLIVSHNINLASNYAERLIFLKEGKLLAAGKPEDLMQKETLKDLFAVELDIMINPHTGHPNIIYP
ncbi:MAG TPA: ABC transporter ATP-binding protein [Candidatus Cloacimonas sp.]|jgi:iron complex transport system ATP-binding protein|nr:ABC transporter ATP-binding protein [Candidatus Cloacimonas sp.]MDD2250421.1 ABC transporter ATP-binding protein [Candidatus Cloacimonadota bacterium]MCK9165681.1 ABC transporter ATP-binding protein [Candidatus Cloacimonas sp.]MDD3734798.1 ABC transporter ATP-binding protein [Candidatus Cloacimonadota bacterium]MDD3870260.1 ABC transporter ATP-binding protein [Candidatus Cloacimonadota bacterium]